MTWPDAYEAMPKQLIEDLASLRPGNAAISELDFLIRHKKFSALEAADIWLARQSEPTKA
ncbi:hypothetical protein HU746_10205 [Pseudomonas lurida]|uniref:hypothetical protein n=1 Tax=Pseudomonas lurida TaxID=244566 RepID=UPI001649585E|nr:hypothetical protein [Pseudomonas lurida]MBC3245020.1 hypothetical protein [Pseudomonas lurida]